MFEWIKSIRNKMLVMCCLLTTIPIITISLYLSNNFQAQMKDEFIDSSTKEISQMDNGLYMYFEQVKENVNYLANHPLVKKADATITTYDNPYYTQMTPSKNGGVETEIFNLYADFAKSHPNFLYIYMGTKDGGFIQYPESNIGEYYDPRIRAWYKTAISNTGEIKVSNADVFAPDNAYYKATVTTITNDQGEIIGVQAVDVGLNQMTEMINKMRIRENGFVMLLERNGRIIADPKNPNNNFKNINELSIPGLENIVNKDHGVLEISVEGKSYLVNVFTSPKTGWKYLAFLEKAELFQRINRLNNVIILIAMFFIIIALILAIFFARRITRTIDMTVNMLKNIAQGEIDFNKRIQIISQDEAGQLARSFNAYMDKLAEQNWVSTKTGDIERIYPAVSDIESLACRLIAELTPMVGASYGVFYLKKGDGKEANFRKIGAYAENSQEVGRDNFRLGEGLVGQCAAENKIIFLPQVPENYIKIASGLGESSPQNIIVLPVEHDGKVVAVIELASFNEFNQLRQNVLTQVITHLGININNIISHMQVEKLLKESQALTEELQTQTEELQSQSEELESQQEELKNINEQLEKQFQNAKQKSQELERIKLTLEEKTRQLGLSSKYKSEFMANMSHELRTPLNSLLILAQILEENGGGNLTPKQVEYAKTIYASGNDLLNLINSILDLAKIESGKMDVSTGPVYFNELHTFVKSQFLPVARKKGVELKIYLDDDLPDVIHTDEQRLYQILKNLLSNALKFTESGSVTMHIHQLNGNIAFSITDSGIGIAQEKLDIIFEAFQQGDGTTGRKYGGTGLGLTISRDMAHLLGGIIQVNSTEGKGSTFTLLLPVTYQKPIFTDTDAPEEAAAAVESDNKEIDKTYDAPDDEKLSNRQVLLKDRKILIVDDDMRNVFALTAVLESQNMTVTFAENGAECLKILQENKDFDLILMDIMMPEMDGYEVMRLIRTMPEFQTLPIIALTAKAMKYDREQCILAGASDYISKPVNNEQLLSLIRVWLYK